MVKDMDSYIDRCIGKEDFFKLATVNDLNSQKTVLGKKEVIVGFVGAPKN